MRDEPVASLLRVLDVVMQPVIGDDRGGILRRQDGFDPAPSSRQTRSARRLSAGLTGAG